MARNPDGPCNAIPGTVKDTADKNIHNLPKQKVAKWLSVEAIKIWPMNGEQ